METKTKNMILDLIDLAIEYHREFEDNMKMVHNAMNEKNDLVYYYTMKRDLSYNNYSDVKNEIIKLLNNN